MATWKVDTSNWPVVVHTVEGHLTTEEADAYIADANRVFERRARHAVVLDSSRSSTGSAEVRARSQRWLTEHRKELHQYCAGIALVLPSPVLRFVAMMVLVVARPPSPYVVCETLPEALEWARRQLASAEAARES